MEGEEPADVDVEIVHDVFHAERPPDASAEIRVIEIPPERLDDSGEADQGASPGHARPAGFVGRTAEAVTSVGVSGVRVLARASGHMTRLFAASPAGRVLSDVASGVLAAVAEDSGVDWRLAGRRAEERLSQVIAVVVPVVAESIDPATIVEKLDVNALMEQVDIDQLLGRVDVNAMLDRVDVTALLDRVDVNALLDRVDVDALMARADVDALLTRVDVDALMQRVDLDALMQRVEVGNVFTRGTGEVAGSALDLARRQGVGLDVVLSRTVNRLIGRHPDQMPVGPSELEVEDGDEERAT
jgi:hypothetical protein